MWEALSMQKSISSVSNEQDVQDQAPGTDGSPGIIGMLTRKTGDTIPQIEEKLSISFSYSSA